MKTLVDLLVPPPPAAALGHCRRGLDLDSVHLDALEELLTQEEAPDWGRRSWARRRLGRLLSLTRAAVPRLLMREVPTSIVLAWVAQFGGNRPVLRWELRRLLGVFDQVHGHNGLPRATSDWRELALVARDGVVVFRRGEGEHSYRSDGMELGPFTARRAAEDEALLSNDNSGKWRYRDDVLAVRGATLVPVAPVPLTSLQQAWFDTFVSRHSLPGPWGRDRDLRSDGHRFVSASGDPVPPVLTAFLDAFLAPEEDWLERELAEAAQAAGWPVGAEADPRAFLRALREQRLGPSFEFVSSRVWRQRKIVGAPPDAEILLELQRLGVFLAGSDYRSDPLPLPPVIDEALDAAGALATTRPDAAGCADLRPIWRSWGSGAEPWLIARGSRSTERFSTASSIARVVIAKLSETVPTFGADVGGSVTYSRISSVSGGAQKVAHSKSIIGSVSRRGISHEPASEIGVSFSRKFLIASVDCTGQSGRRYGTLSFHSSIHCRNWGSLAL